MPRLDLRFQLVNLPIEFLEVLGQAFDQLSKRRWQLITCSLEQGRHPLGHVGDAFGDAICTINAFRSWNRRIRFNDHLQINTSPDLSNRSSIDTLIKPIAILPRI